MKKIITYLLLLMSTAASAIQTPSHLQYNQYMLTTQVPEGYYNMDMHLTWHKEPDVRYMGFYAQFAFYFQNGAGGYTGLQQDNYDGKKAIFSIWDKGNAQTAFPVASNCQRFGHEGTGAMCLKSFQWKAGHEYKMRVWRIKDSYNGSTEKWGGWVVDYTTGEETLIGIIEVKNTDGHKGYGGLAGSAITVSEFYGSNNREADSITCASMPYFGTTWYGPFANNGSIAPDYVSSSYNTTMGTACPNNVRAVSPAPYTVVAENGGAITRVNNEYQNIWEKYNLANLKEIDCTYTWAEQQIPEMFNQALFLHRRISRSKYNLYYRDYTHNGTGHSLMLDTTTNHLILGKPDGTIDHLGDADYWKRQAGCKR